jgi:hypothetical protein
MKRNGSLIVWGIILLVGGVLLLLAQAKIIVDIQSLIVPIILLGLGLAFHLQYFFSGRKNEGVLVPGGILLVYGLLFLAVQRFGQSFQILWPLFILGTALGLFELYVFSRGRSGSMAPVFILTAIGGGALLFTCGVVSDWNVFIAALLIVIGASLMAGAFVRGYRKNASNDSKADQMPEQEPGQKPQEKADEAPKNQG